MNSNDRTIAEDKAEQLPKGGFTAISKTRKANALQDEEKTNTVERRERLPAIHRERFGPDRR